MIGIHGWHATPAHFDDRVSDVLRAPLALFIDYLLLVVWKGRLVSNQLAPSHGQILSRQDYRIQSLERPTDD